MNILNPDIENYLNTLFTQRSDVLKEMESYAEIEDFPIIGPIVGKYIQQLTYLVEMKEKQIFEMGSGYGYSAHWFAKGSNDDVTIHCTDFDENNKELAYKYFNRAGIEDRIDFHVGNGIEVLEKIEHQFDIIFCDIKKEDYPKALEIALPKLRVGGLLLFDNTLWSGKVLDVESTDVDTLGVIKFNEIISEQYNLVSSIIPARDGLSVSIKVEK